MKLEQMMNSSVNFSYFCFFSASHMGSNTKLFQKLDIFFSKIKLDIFFYLFEL